jgi:putative ATP-dependent endonuclease of OLD family
MQLRQLTILRYRGIETFTWNPAPGLNCLIGPGDSFKTTILSAISLLLAPYPLGACSEFDFHRRRIADGFEIEAYIGSLDLRSLGAEQRLPHLYGWRNHAAAPLPEGDAEPVLRCRVRGTADLELIYELPIDGTDDPPTFTAGLRRKLMLARLAGEERAARDLRLGTGSLLDRHLKTGDMRAPVHGAIANAAAEMVVPAPADTALRELSRTFGEAGLPSNLHLGLVPVQGAALVGMVALASGDSVREAIPLAYAGTGTKQMALLTLSAALAGAAPVLVIDEPERGLEPYRQRSIIKTVTDLAGTEGQAFITTHAPAVLEMLSAEHIWRMRGAQSPCQFQGAAIARLLRSDPDAFFAVTPILCEGATEQGLLDQMLPPLIGRDIDGCGIRLIDGSGQPNVLEVADGFIAAGIIYAAFLDNEAAHTGRRGRIQAQRTTFVWNGSINIEEATCKWLPLNNLFSLLETASEASGVERRYLEDQIFLQIPEEDRQGRPRELETAGYAEQTLRRAFYEAMTRHTWFKTRNGGRLLAGALTDFGMPAEIRQQIDQFGERVRRLLT